MDIDPDFYDAELRLHNAHLRTAANIQPHDRVLDVGCGTGQTTREAARAAVYGSALGVDLSAPMLERARRLSDDAGLRNVTYVQADAQTHPFPPAHFDLCISRFGTMFFTDPVAAFTNIGRALRPGARLVQLVWQDHDRNEWATAIRDALTAGTAAPAPTTNHPGRPGDHRRHPGRRRLRRGRLHRRPQAGLLRPGHRHRLRRGAPLTARQGPARRPGPHHGRARTRTAPRHRRRA
jgi:SAM-dependent methyltransferase